MHFLLICTQGSLIICSKAGDKLIFYNAMEDTYTFDEIFKDKTVVNTKFRIVVDSEESGRDVRSSINTHMLMPISHPWDC